MKWQKLFDINSTFGAINRQRIYPSYGGNKSQVWWELSLRIGNSLQMISQNIFLSYLPASSPSRWKGISCLGADSTSCDSILGYCPNFGHISNKFERNGAVTTFTAFMGTGWRHFLRWVKDTVNFQYSCSRHWAKALLEHEVDWFD